MFAVAAVTRREECSQEGANPGRGFASHTRRRCLQAVKSILIALLTLSVRTASSQEQKEGEFCLTDEGYEGICRPLRHCPYALSKPNVYYSSGSRTPDLCSSGSYGTIVCCPTVTPKTTSKPTQAPATVSSTSRVRIPPPPTAAPAQPTRFSDPGDTVVVAPAEGDKGEKRISDKKCQEYMNSIQLEAISLSADGKPSDVWCPYPPPGKQLIVGGTTANAGEFPHMAALGYVEFGKVEWLCGGSLISRSYVLTAAHCLRGSLIAVQLGTLQVTSLPLRTVREMMEEERSDVYAVAESLRHPQFGKFSHYDDIALVRLQKPVPRFDSVVRPACLHSGPIDDEIQTAVACGFGHTKYQDSSTLHLLRHVTLNMYDPDVCNQVFSAKISTMKLSRGIIKSQICAGHLAGGKDTCDGDSGGPLQMKDKENKCITRIIGVTSFGTVLCGSKNTAALYTNVAHYLPWIESVVWPTH